MQSKIKTLKEIEELIADLREGGKKIVHCHGVFDLLHPGHIQHFQEARTQGDALVVSITPDRFVNKGPGRPAFNESLRLESLAALGCVDYVVLNDAPDAVPAISRIRPHVYVKGAEYRAHEKDVTGKIQEEAAAVESHGGNIHYTTDDVVFSSSSLINRFFDSSSPEVVDFMTRFKQKYRFEQLLEKIERLSDLNVLIIGDAIIDEYQYVSPLGQSGKGVHLTARCLDKEVFLGGSLIMANHLAQFAKKVTLLTAVGRNCPYRPFIDKALDSRVEPILLESAEEMTLTKKRYVLKDGKQLSKLFETYSTTESFVKEAETAIINEFLKKSASQFDLVLVADFGNGFTNPSIIDHLSAVPTTLAVNTQTNSGNRGYNVVTHYKRADFISLNEPELRLAAHDRYNELPIVIAQIASRLQCPHISVTRGVGGVTCYTQNEQPIIVPALTSSVVDRVGAGDNYFSLAALCLARGYSHEEAGFIGSLAASMNVQTVGNRESSQKPALCKYLTRLMK